MSATEHMPLCDLRPGETGQITQVSLEASPEVRERVLALGFVPGTVVRSVRKAPLGDPTEYELRGGRVSLRRSEARLLSVTK